MPFHIPFSTVPAELIEKALFPTIKFPVDVDEPSTNKSLVKLRDAIVEEAFIIKPIVEVGVKMFAPLNCQLLPALIVTQVKVSPITLTACPAGQPVG